MPDLNPIAQRARRRIALRLLPFLFLLYVICYVDRANVSFANLRMSADLGFSDRVYGLGVGMFFIGYVLFEVPGVIVLERWSARKWIARIMITWGLATVLTGFVRTSGQFYAVRFFVGVAEASFFPGVIVYLTYWFRKDDRAKAIASFYAAVPAASVFGSLIATWLLGVHWRGLTGWRWIFILEGIPPMLLGIITIFYLTDRPREAGWLSADERDWIDRELQREAAAKKSVRDYTILQAFGDKQILLLILAYFFAHCGAQASTYWVPTIIKRLSGLPSSQVALLAALPGLVGILAMLGNGWHSDKTNERRWHSVIPLLIAACGYLLLLATHNFTIVIMLLIVGGGVMFGYYPVFWSMPTLVLTETAAAASFGFINSIGQTGGFVGPYAVGYLNQRTGSLSAAFAFIGISYLLAGSVLATARIQIPKSVAPANLATEKLPGTAAAEDFS
jgi:ACS family tartrate transporter-like MFS transporter